MLLPILITGLSLQNKLDLDYLHQVAKEVTAGCRVAPDEVIPGVGKNETGYALRFPGANKNYYPAFWIRDAAMMLGADLVPAKEVDGWIRVIAKTQPGKAGIHLPHNMFVPGFSIPDHITLKGEACWYPGAYAGQGVGDYGIEPPSDDAFYFIQMIYERYRLTKDRGFLKKSVSTGYGKATVLEVAERAFNSVNVTLDFPHEESAYHIHAKYVMTTEATRSVDWGFCDSISKTGILLMPSLLRIDAGTKMAELERVAGNKSRSLNFEKEAYDSGYSLLHYVGGLDEALLLYSSSKIGHQGDIWANAYALSLGVLSERYEDVVAKGLLEAYRKRGIVLRGQVRQLISGQYWEKSICPHDAYQNGGYWATPTGWLIVALNEVDKTAAHELFHAYVRDLREHRKDGAPFEWINPKTGQGVNANYASSVGLVYISLVRGAFK